MERIFSSHEIGKLAGLAPIFRPLAELVINAVNARCKSEDCHATLVYGRRTDEEQLGLYAQGRALVKAGLDPRRYASWRPVDERRIVTEALPGDSAHNAKDGLSYAIDLALLEDQGNAWLPGGKSPDPRWARFIGEEAQRLGLIWGGHFRRFDGAHVELRDWQVHARGRG